jgi:tetratricopeptide (TPR) repeat protein
MRAEAADNLRLWSVGLEQGHLMRDAIQNLAKAAVTALIRSDPSMLAIEGGKLAIDRLFGWLPQKGKLEALIARVEGELERLAEVEFKGRADLEPAIANATILFETFGLTATELVDLSLKPERATAELLTRGKEVLRAAGEAVAGLCGGRIVPRVHQLLLSDPQTIGGMSTAIASALLSQREAIDKLPDEVGPALGRMLGRHLVIDPTEVWRPEVSDIYLLRAEYGVVPFHEQRRPEVERLLAWCEAGSAMAVRVVTGAGGTGKTRLMIELCRHARGRRWRAGFLHRETPVKPSWELDGLVDGEAPLLLVVDYAETKRDVLVPVLRRLSLDHASPKTRVILVARAVSDWLPDLRRADPKMQELLDETRVEVEELAAIAMPIEERAQILQAAAAEFADRLAVLTDIHHRRTRSPDLSAPHFANALFLHIAALAAVVGDAAKEEEALLHFVLDREEGRHWQTGLASAHLAQDLDVRSVAQAEALITLAGGVESRAEARTLLGRVPHLAGLAPPKRDRLIDLLHRLYPSERHLEPLRPDLLGEELVDRALSDDPELLKAAFGEGVSGTQVRNGLTVLTRLAQRRPVAERWLEQALASDLEGLAEPAIQVAIETGHSMGKMLAEALEAQPLKDPARLEPLIPWKTGALLDVGVIVMTQQWNRMPEIPQPWTDENKLTAARIANNLAYRLSEAGRFREALTHAQEAARLYRELAQNAPEDHFIRTAALNILASALNNLGNRLSEVGDYEAALAATEEAVAIRRELANKAPDAFRPDLARALNTLANRLSELSRFPEAVACAREAVDLYRPVADETPDAYEPDLAMALNTLAVRLSEVGQSPEALACAREGVDPYRSLADKAPDAFRPGLAKALYILASCFRDVDQPHEALAPSQEAAAHYRELADRVSDVYEPDLALALHALANLFVRTSEPQAALAAAQEASDRYRQLADKKPDAFRPDLALALNTLSVAAAPLGRPQEEREAIEEATKLYQQLAEKEPAAYGAEFAMALMNLAECLEANGDLVGATEQDRQAITVYWHYFHAQEPAFVDQMCKRYVECCEKLGREPDEALLGPIAAVLHQMQEGSGDDA